jgi:hypothetical protein
METMSELILTADKSTHSCLIESGTSPSKLGDNPTVTPLGQPAEPGGEGEHAPSDVVLPGNDDVK